MSYAKPLMPDSVQTGYRDRLASGEIAPDAAQAAAVEALSRLEGELNALSEPSFSFGLKHRKRAPPQGVYLYGPVGRGKSMIMDLFFESAPLASKRRVHFHAFMGETHGLIAQWRKGDAAARKARFGQSHSGRHASGDDPIPPVAHLLAGGARLLCFDEFHVTDIADAMILGRLFEAMWAQGVVIVATSNRAPDALYENGLNRQLFLPFLAELKAHMQVVRVDGPKDFRLDRLKGRQVYFSPIDTVSRAAFDALWSGLHDGEDETGETLEVQGRRLRLPQTVGGHLRSSFVSLCGVNLGAQDYLAIARRFHSVFVEDVPKLESDRRNEAARFVALVDALYEARCKLAVLAEAEPDALYPAGDGAFEFERTASRLEEMRSADYVNAAATEG